MPEVHLLLLLLQLGQPRDGGVPCGLLRRLRCLGRAGPIQPRGRVKSCDGLVARQLQPHLVTKQVADVLAPAVARKEREEGNGNMKLID